MKKQVISTALAIIVAAAVIVPVFLWVRMTIQDHRALGQVVTYLQAQIEASNRAAQSAPVQ